MTDNTRWAKVLVKGISGLSNNDSWRPSDRLVPFNIRKETKGLGAGSFMILKNEAISDANERSGKDFTEDDILGMREVIVYDGRGVDSSAINDADDALGRIIFRGFIRKPTVDTFQNSVDGIGRVTVDEYGVFLSQKPLIYTEVTPDFNPEYNNIQYGNYKSSGFRDSDFVKRDEVGKWEYPEGESSDLLEQEYVWNRKRIIEFLVEQEELISNITFPWDAELIAIEQDRLKSRNAIDEDSSLTTDQKDELKKLIDNGAAKQSSDVQKRYKWFFDDDLNPISNYEGDSIITALSELIPESCDFYFDYNEDSSGPTLVIFNKSVVDLPGLHPAGIPVNFNLPDNTDVFNLTVHADEIYDKVTVRGKPILWCGTLTLWDVLGDAALKKSWTPEDEVTWLNGDIQEELEGIDGTGIGNERINEILRRNLDRVFQRFEWNHPDGIPVVGARSGNFEEDETGPIVPKKAFFGTYTGIGLSEGADKDVLLPNHEIFTSLAQHRTPNRLAIEWEEFLPFPRFSKKIEEQYPNAIQLILEEEELATPFVVCPTIELIVVPGEYWVDRSFPFDVGSSCQIGYWEKGIWVRRESPQTDLHDIDEMWKLKETGDIRARVSTELNLDEIENLKLNPNLEEYIGKSNYNRFLITVAGRSRERLEAYKTRKDKNGQNVEIRKTKTIEIDDCEIWCVHSNTVRGLTPYGLSNYNIPALGGEGSGENNRDNMKGSIIRFSANDTISEELNPTGVHVVRDDRVKLLEYLEAYSNLLMTPRGEMNLIVGLQNPTELEMGQLVGLVNDNGVKYEINSAVTSIEYTFEGGPPRVSYQTLKPSVPEITRNLREAQEARGSRPPNVTDTKFARIKI